MSSEKRLVLFMILTFFSFLGIQYVMDVTGLNPPPPKNPPRGQANAKPDEAKTKADRLAAADKAKDKDKDNEKAVDAAPAGEAKPKGPRIALLKASELVIGSAADKTPKGYRLEVQLEQKGAGVATVRSSRFDAEFGEGRNQRRRPLELLRDNSPLALPSMATNVRPASSPKPEATLDDEGRSVVATLKGETESPLAETLWEVVRDDQGRVVRPVTRVDPVTKAVVEGQEIVLHATADDPAVTLTKKFRIWKGQDDFEMDLGIASPEKTQDVVYRLFGPHGIPIEGEWYTGTFRDVYFGQVRDNKISVVTRSAHDIAKPKAPRFDNTTLPLAFAGIENQYFAVFVEPVPIPVNDAERRDAETVATVIDFKTDEVQKADISVEIFSKPIQVGPNKPFAQTYRVFAGPKTLEALSPYGAEELVQYRKYQWFGIPGASTMARYVIAPLLDRIYGLTESVAGFFGGKAGNYGVAIILLTLLVRMIMFPLGRKQALAAKKMQDLQPLMKEIQEKYKDDKEKQTRETFALYKKYGVNPVGGCLPALIQLPIFVGLWQALNNSVHLRHASFLYIQNLAAPDMLFRIPVEGGVPLLGQYFNLLPFLVVSLMLVQTKLFAPPATTPEAEMQQKMMKYMMIFMAFMFYKVPSGLGIYFITSSLWQISERLLLPKVSHITPVTGGLGDDKNPPGGRGGGGGGRGGDGDNGAPAKPPGRIAQFWEKVKQEAAKDNTHRNVGLNTADDRERGRDKGKPRAKPGGGDADAVAPPVDRPSRPSERAAMSSLDPTDTIAAVASPPGAGFRGLVRVTGPDAGPVALGGFTCAEAAPWPSRPERRSGRLAVKGLRPGLPASIAFWPGTRTYTGQPLAEIHTSGSAPLVNLVLADCLARGARHAEPGEFTLRAFLSGRIDLTRAEAVLGVIDARTPAQLDAALEQLAGGLAGPITALRDRLLDVLAHLEANLDFAEEADVDPLGRAALAGDLDRAGREMTALAGRLAARDRPEGQPRVVLVGPPNAGKSLLFNALLGQSRALVSPRAGTTRDYLSAPCDCDGLTVELIDTAGVEPAAGRLEGRAQALGADQADRADLLLDCRSREAAPPNPAATIAPDRPRLLVATKIDLAPPGPDGSPGTLPTSALSGAGLPELRRAVAAALRSRDADGDPLASTGARCREGLARAGDSLLGAAATLLAGGGDELVAVDLRQAIDDLGKVVGAVVTDDVLDRIFRRFCIGK